MILVLIMWDRYLEDIDLDYTDNFVLTIVDPLCREVRKNNHKVYT